MTWRTQVAAHRPGTSAMGFGITRRPSCQWVIDKVQCHRTTTLMLAARIRSTTRSREAGVASTRASTSRVDALMARHDPPGRAPRRSREPPMAVRGTPREFSQFRRPRRPPGRPLVQDDAVTALLSPSVGDIPHGVARVDPLAHRSRNLVAGSIADLGLVVPARRQAGAAPGPVPHVRVRDCADAVAGPRLAITGMLCDTQLPADEHLAEARRTVAAERAARA